MNTDKALSVLPFCGVVHRDRDGKPTTVHTPAGTRFDNGKRGGARYALVTLDRPKDSPGVVRCTCLNYQYGNDRDGAPCLAASGPHVCYHTLAAVFAVAAEAGCFVNWYGTQEQADAARGDGWTLRVESGTAKTFAVLALRKPKESQPAPVQAEVVKPESKPAPLAVKSATVEQPATVEPLALTLFPVGDDGRDPADKAHEQRRRRARASK